MTLPGQSGSNTPAGRDWVPRKIRDVEQQLATLRGQVSQNAVKATAATTPADPGSPSSLGPPQSISVSAVAYPAAGGSTSSIADVTVGWDPPDDDPSGAVSVVGYEISYALVHPAPSTLANPSASSSLWTGKQEVDISAVVTISKLRSGDQFTARVDAIDSRGQRTTYAYSNPILLPTYTDEPNTPSLPVVDSYLGVLRSRWDGLDSTGQSMFGDGGFDHIEVHWSTNPDFTPSSSTRTDTLTAAGSSFLTTASYGTTYYCRFLGVSRVGDTSDATPAVAGTPGQVVADDLLAGCVGSAALADLAVITAKIGNLAVNDAQIGSVAVGKLTAGYLTAQVTISGSIATATTGARCVFDAAGIHLYNSSGGLVVDINTSGTATFTGNITGSQITGSALATNVGASGSAIAIGPTSVYPGIGTDSITWVNSATTQDAYVGLNKLGSAYSLTVSGPTNSSASNAPFISFTSDNSVTLGGTGGISTQTALTVGTSLTVNNNIAVSGVARLGGSGNVDAGGAAGTSGVYISSGGDLYGSGVFGSGKSSGSVGSGGSGTFGVYFSAVGTGYFSGNVHANGSLLTSTIRHKYDVQDHTIADNLLDRIRLVTYRSTHTAELFETEDLGVIAEELLEHEDLARFVHHENDRPYSVDYTKLTLAALVSLNTKLEARLAKAGI